MTASSRQSELGQATVELALCLPLVALLASMLVEIGGVAADHIRVWHAAREAARVAVVDPDPSAIREAAERSGLHGIEVEVEPAPSDRVAGEPLTVRAVYDRPPLVPVVGSVLEGIVIEASTTMRIEDP